MRPTVPFPASRRRWPGTPRGSWRGGGRRAGGAGRARAIDVQPLAEYAIAEGDDLAASGQPAVASQAYQLVGAIEQLYKANGVNVDLELALFDADHTPGQAALARARAGFKVRPSYLGHEVV